MKTEAEIRAKLTAMQQMLERPLFQRSPVPLAIAARSLEWVLADHQTGGVEATVIYIDEATAIFTDEEIVEI